MALVQSENKLRGYDYGNNVTNGIAYDALENVYYVTGKRWNMMFKLKMDESVGRGLLE